MGMYKVGSYVAFLYLLGLPTLGLVLDLYEVIRVLDSPYCSTEVDWGLSATYNVAKANSPPTLDPCLLPSNPSIDKAIDLKYGALNVKNSSLGFVAYALGAEGDRASMKYALHQGFI
nr:hypothetical protein Iba_chr04bCG13390 [Ipomoea batatas]